MLFRQRFKMRDRLPDKISDLQVSKKMTGRETKFILQLSKGRKVVVDVKLYDGGQAFVGPLYISSIHRARFKIRILTYRSVGGHSGKIQHTLDLFQNLKCVTHNKIILKTDQVREIQLKKELWVPGDIDPKTHKVLGGNFKR